jgi:hypothetical protein
MTALRTLCERAESIPREIRCYSFTPATAEWSVASLPGVPPEPPLPIDAVGWLDTGSLDTLAGCGLQPLAPEDLRRFVADDDAQRGIPDELLHS